MLGFPPRIEPSVNGSFDNRLRSGDTRNSTPLNTTGRGKEMAKVNKIPNESVGISIDPITLEVIRHGIISICDQIDANMTRTAFSPYIYEYKDYAVGFVSVDGELLAQCTGGMPVFVADSVGMAVKDGLVIY